MPKIFEYYVLVTENENGEIVSIFSPDLNKDLLVEDECGESKKQAEEIINFREFAKRKLSEILAEREKILIPKRFRQLGEIPITELQHWESFKVRRPEKRMVFERCLPGTGHALNLVAFMTHIFITFMALSIASNDEEHSGKSTALAIAGSLFSGFINLFLYITSDASGSLAEIGCRVDNLCRSEDMQVLRHEGMVISSRDACKYRGIALTAGGCILANAVITYIKLYQEFILLTEKYLQLYPSLTTEEHDNYYQLIKALVVFPSITAMSYTSVAFQGSFARLLIEEFSSKVARVKPSDHESKKAAETAKLIDRFKNASDTLSSLPESSDDTTVSPEAGRALVSQYTRASNQDLDISPRSSRSIPMSSLSRIS